MGDREQLRPAREPLMEHRWGIVCADNENPGTDVRSQLQDTLRRTHEIIPRSRTLMLLTKAHAEICEDVTAAFPAFQTILQPRHRGSLPGILWSLLRLRALDRNGVAAFFPCHFQYQPEHAFLARVTEAFDIAELNPQFVILLGAPADDATAAQNWIEPRRTVLGNGGALHPVARFVTHPATEMHELRGRGALWCTAVMVGCVAAFLDLIQAATPELFHTFVQAVGKKPKANEGAALEMFYAKSESWDLAAQVLSVSPNRLAVLGLDDTQEEEPDGRGSGAQA